MKSPEGNAFDRSMAHVFAAVRQSQCIFISSVDIGAAGSSFRRNFGTSQEIGEAQALTTLCTEYIHKIAITNNMNAEQNHGDDFAERALGHDAVARSLGERDQGIKVPGFAPVDPAES